MTYDITTALLSAPTVTPSTARSGRVSAHDSDDQSPLPTSPSGKTLPLNAKQAAPTADKLEQVVKQLNDYAQTVQREVQFKIDKDSGQTLIKVIDSRTKEVIRQIPSEEALAVDRYLAHGNGLVFQAKA